MKSVSLRICFITEDFYPDFIGGQGVYGYHLVSEMVKMGHQVWVLAEKRGEREKFWKGKIVRLICVPFCFGNQIILALLEYLWFILKCGNTNFDIVHANQLSGLFFVLFKPKNVQKVIVSIHNTNFDMWQITESEFKRFLYKILIFLENIVYKKADGLIFNSPREEQALQKYYKFENKPTRAIYLGVDMPKFNKEERKKMRQSVRQSLNLNENSKIVLYVGRLVKRKRIDQLIKTVKLLKDDVVAIIIGDGKEKDRLKEMAPSNAYILGFVKDTKPYLLASDCFVTVSLAEGGFSLAVLEAASVGLPLVVSPSVAGFPIVKEGENGFIVDPDNPEELADRIKRIIGDRRVIREMGEESRKIARQFSWEKCASKTVDFYHFLLKR